MTYDGRPPEGDLIHQRVDEPTEPATTEGSEPLSSGTEPPGSGYEPPTTASDPRGSGYEAEAEPSATRTDVGTAWRQVGDSLASLGSGVGDALRQAWEGTSPSPKSAPEGLRQLADALERGIDTARSAATSPEARQRVNEDARRAGERLDRAVRLSIAEIGRTLQRVEPKD